MQIIYLIGFDLSSIFSNHHFILIPFSVNSKLNKMKPGLDVLPIEVWMSVFDNPWIEREQLAEIVHLFRERKFVDFLQYFLHRWGQHKLNEVAFDKNGMYKWVDFENQPYLDFPLAPLPENINSFDSVAIDDSDGYAQGLAFLRIIKPILEDVNLTIYRVSPNSLENLRIVLDRILPLLNKGIQSLHLYGNASVLPTIGQHLGDKLAKLKMLKIFHADDDHVRMDAAMRQQTVKFVLDWLNSPRDGNEPKLCEAFIDKEYWKQITKAIQEQFKVATTPCTFALIFPSNCIFPDFHWQKAVGGRLYPEEWETGIAEFHDNNGIGEELHWLKVGYELFRLIRHQSGRHPQLQQWIGENQYHRPMIAVSIPTDPIDAAKLDAAMDDVDNDKKDNDKQDENKDKKPSTSKDV